MEWKIGNNSTYKSKIEEKEGIYLAWGNLDTMADGYGFLRDTNVKKISMFQLHR